MDFVEAEPSLGELEVQIVLAAAIKDLVQLAVSIVIVVRKDKSVVKENDGPVLKTGEDLGHSFLQNKRGRRDTLRHELWSNLPPRCLDRQILRRLVSESELVERIHEVQVQIYLVWTDLLQRTLHMRNRIMPSEDILVDCDVVAAEANERLSRLRCNDEATGNTRVTPLIEIAEQSVKLPLGSLVESWIDWTCFWLHTCWQIILPFELERFDIFDAFPVLRHKNEQTLGTEKLQHWGTSSKLRRYMLLELSKVLFLSLVWGHFHKVQGICERARQWRLQILGGLTIWRY
mmetsp:Transcript_15253/g.25418  ORF Transcript_15253/g.25418 Transcript_15253/m.25418 type:complete len:289 (-) Transcript_15253:5304-6170(-)